MMGDLEFLGLRETRALLGCLAPLAETVPRDYLG